MFACDDAWDKVLAFLSLIWYKTITFKLLKKFLDERCNVQNTLCVFYRKDL